MNTIVQVVALALAVSAASFIITRAKITEPIRVAAGKRLVMSARTRWLGDLLSCPLCTSVWLAAGAAGLYRPTLVHLWLPLDVAVSWMLIVAVSAYSIGFMTVAIMPEPARPVIVNVKVPKEVEVITAGGNVGGAGGGSTVAGGRSWASVYGGSGVANASPPFVSQTAQAEAGEIKP